MIICEDIGPSHLLDLKYGWVMQLFLQHKKNSKETLLNPSKEYSRKTMSLTQTNKETIPIHIGRVP